MKSKEFITESKTMDPDLYEEMDATNIVPEVQRVFDRMYPGTKIYSDDEVAGIHISTALDDNGEVYHGGTRTEDPEIWPYDIELGAGIADGAAYIAINHASAGDYKGVTTEIFKAIFSLMERTWGIPNRKIISAWDDKSGGVWEKIAKKLGAEHENNTH